MSKSSRLRHHIFVCQNERPLAGRPSCAARGSAELLAAFERGLQARPALWGLVAVTPCGCLGPCFDGPSVVVYPEAVWYANLTPADAAEILDQHIAGGQPVARLQYDWPEDSEDSDD